MQKIVSNLILSPMIFIIILIIIVLLIKRLKINQTRGILLFIIITIYILSIEPTKDVVITPLESKFSRITEKELEGGEVYVLLGGGVHQGIEYPSEVALGRIAEAVRLYRISKKTIIVTGGIVYWGNISESEVYKKFLIDLGVDPSDIIIEERSRTTNENAIYTKDILQTLNFNRIILVTSATHMNRAKMSFENVGLNVIPAPGVYVSDYSKYDLTSFLPSFRNLELVFRGLWEHIGFIFYKIKNLFPN